MNIEELSERLRIPEQMRERIAAVSVGFDTADFEEYITGLMDRKKAAAAYGELVKALREDTDSVKMLICQLEAARRQHAVYAEKGIPDEIYYATYGCFARFIGECLVRRGELAFDRGWWSYRQTGMSLFRIGQLEYELFDEEGEPMVSIHIPSDADFAPERVEESLEAARAFMKKFYPEYDGVPYICDSWLLAPKLGELLPESSNIKSFQNRFMILKEFPEAMDCIEWLFHSLEGSDYSRLPEDTSLQRKVKEKILRGENVGIALGQLKLRQDVN